MPTLCLMGSSEGEMSFACRPCGANPGCRGGLRATGRGRSHRNKEWGRLSLPGWPQGTHLPAACSPFCHSPPAESQRAGAAPGNRGRRLSAARHRSLSPILHIPVSPWLGRGVWGCTHPLSGPREESDRSCECTRWSWWQGDLVLNPPPVAQGGGEEQASPCLPRPRARRGSHWPQAGKGPRALKLSG